MSGRLSSGRRNNTALAPLLGCTFPARLAIVSIDGNLAVARPVS
jgi:hypothetical protein